MFPKAGGFAYRKTCASGLLWKVVDTLPEGGQTLDNPKLAEALKEKREFTHEEWDSFGIKDLSRDHTIKSGDNFLKPSQAPGRALFYPVRLCWLLCLSPRRRLFCAHALADLTLTNSPLQVVKHDCPKRHKQTRRFKHEDFM